VTDELMELLRRVDWDEVVSCIQFTESDWVGAADVSDLPPLCDLLRKIQETVNAAAR
jgi:hypothetical protein